MIPLFIPAIARRIGLKGAIIAGLLLFGTVQTARLHFSIAKVEACVARSERLNAENATMRSASIEAGKRAVAAREAQQRRFEQLAEEHQNERDQIQISADRALRDYAIRNRVRPQTGGDPSGGTFTTPGNDDPSLPLELSADSIVAAGYADLQICTDLATYALEAHHWATDLTE